MPHLKTKFALVVDERELATILAALRFHQDENLQISPDIPDQAIKDIASDCGSLKPLNFGDVSKLCERINLCEESHLSLHKEVWVSLVMDRNRVVDAQAYDSKFQAEKAILCYLRNHCGYKGQDGVAEARNWVAKRKGALRVETCLVKVDCSAAVSSSMGLIIAPPPEEKGDEPLFRVVYVIDVNAGEVNEAAEYTHRIMSDPNPLPPVLHVIDHEGETTTVDLSSGGHGHKRSSRQT